MNDRFQVDRFLLNQKALALTSQYWVLNEQEQPLFFLKQKFLTFLPEVEVFESDTAPYPVMTIKREKWLELLPSFTFRDQNGHVLGSLKKKFSMMRSVWEIRDASGLAAGRAEQDSESMMWSMMNRNAGREYSNFEIYFAGARVGVFNRKFSLFDKYVMDLTADPGKALDRRIALGIAIVLDIGERR